jgi:very-short-patch-repair endonuclease
MSDEQNWLELESVQKHLARAAKWAAAEARHRVEEDVPDRVLYDEPRVESPIEAIFVIWWHAVGLLHFEDAGSILSLLHQNPVTANGNKYRLDFQVTEQDVDLWLEADRLGVPLWQMAVEVDGHGFHERTKEQVAYRNQRDRDLAQDDWTIFHFSGTELCRDPVRCVEQVMNAGLSKHWEFVRRLRKAKQERARE